MSSFSHQDGDRILNWARHADRGLRRRVRQPLRVGRHAARRSRLRLRAHLQPGRPRRLRRGCDAVWPLLTEYGVESIAGNYDIAIGRGDDDCGCGYSSERDNHFAADVRLHQASTAGLRGVDARPPGRAAGGDRRGGRAQVHGSPLRSTTSSGSRCRTPSCASGSRARTCCCAPHGASRGSDVDGTLVVNVGAVGRPANDGGGRRGTRCSTSTTGEARADLVPVAYDCAPRPSRCARRVCRAVRGDDRERLVDHVPGGRAAAGAFARALPRLPRGDAVGLRRRRCGWADAPEQEDDGLPVVSMFGTELFPPRLWVYSNFHCNLACDYCVVASSPTRASARSRSTASGRWWTRRWRRAFASCT